MSLLQAKTGTNSGAVATIAFDSNVAANSVIVVEASWGNTTAASSPGTIPALGISSWTKVRDCSNSSDGQAGAMWLAITTASGACTVTWTLPNSNFINAAGKEFSGIDTADPIATSNFISNQLAASCPTGSVTPPVDGCMIESFFCSTSGQGAAATKPTNFTARALTAQVANADWLQTTAATLNPTWTATNGGWAGITLALRPASSGLVGGSVIQAESGVALLLESGAGAIFL